MWDWQPHCHLWVTCLENVGASTCHDPPHLHSLLQGQCYLITSDCGSNEHFRCLHLGLTNDSLLHFKWISLYLSHSPKITMDTCDMAYCKCELHVHLLQVRIQAQTFRSNLLLPSLRYKRFTKLHGVTTRETIILILATLELQASRLLEIPKHIS
jgi:hypothetical protein